MKINISKYFWNLNEKVLRETEMVLKNQSHPKFIVRMVTFLSRCDQPKKLFSLISKKEFIEIWPRIKSYWLKVERESDFREWWQTIYEQILEEFSLKKKTPKGKPPVSFLKIGRVVRDARIRKGLSQKELAIITSINQPDISMIEDGRKNITLDTLLRLCKALAIKRIDLP